MTNSEQLQKNNERIEAVTLLIQSKAAGGQATLTAEQLITLLEDTETVVSMLSDDGSKIKLQLSASQVNRIMKALTTPTIAPSETELVAIDDGNSQVLLTIGDGLVIEDGELKSTVGGFDGDFNNLKNVPTASEGTKGLIQIASDLDVVAGTNTTKAINAKQLNVAIQGLGTVFRIKGSKQLAAELPSTGNTIGDVWYVSDESVGYIWLNDGTKERWEQLGLPIDLTGYALKSDLTNYATKTELNAVSTQLSTAQTDISNLKSDNTTNKANISALQTLTNTINGTYVKVQVYNSESEALAASQADPNKICLY